MSPIEIPQRSLFKPHEVCQIAQIQPYVLRSWEAEFADLGVASSPGASRFYRRTDVERVLEIKHLLFVEGLTLAGVRRRLGEAVSEEPPTGPALDELLGRDACERIAQVRQGLREILHVLSRDGGPWPSGADALGLRHPPARPPRAPSRRRPGGAAKARRPVHKRGSVGGRGRS